MTNRSCPELNLTPKPVEGPLSREAFFDVRPPAVGARACRRLGLGTASLGKTYGQPDQDQGIETLHLAWRSGFALVDTAPGYGPAELLLSEALRRWHGDRPVVATKTCQRYPHLSDVIGTYRTSAERLGRIDLLAVHDARADFPSDARNATADHLTGLVTSGEISALGLGGGGPAVQAQWLEVGAFRYAITFNRLGAMTLQGLEDTVPQARRHGAAVFAASPLFMGMLGARQAELLADPPPYLSPAFIERVHAVKRLTEAWSLSLTHLAMRFLLSMPMVDVVVSGAANPREWEDVQAAYEAGPLPAELYGRIWETAQEGPEVMVGG